MKIALDLYGGDNAPLAPLEGAALAVKELGVEILAVGKEAEARALCAQKGIPTAGIEFLDAALAMPVCAEPTEVLKSYKESSLAVAVKALSDGKADALVTAGSTGALVVAATFVAKRLKGVKRAALATEMPGLDSNYMLLDLGANVECRPEMLLQFAVMGAAYMEKTAGVPNPRVGLINIGAEESKGTDLQKDAYDLLLQSKLNFVGNVEPRDLPFGACDVAVADGWTGNIVLKTTEGTGLAFSKMVKRMFLKNALTKIGSLAMRSGIRDFKRRTDYAERGGAPLLGITKPVIKAHGSSGARAFRNALAQAKIFYETDVNGAILAALAGSKEEAEE
ncbi:MAG TPA: phosphate acyltransferase PlsX [Oscillospiraceae bacterium]|nr:phosphate acyltransferase PlsX [Oscillospiraceae bacterium]HNW05166.1 phosphate acyltransferase PlsX [Oscillospiraceae bacterium]